MDNADAGSMDAGTTGRPAYVAGTRLRPVVRAGGGARALIGWYDSTRFERCTFETAADGQVRCLTLEPVQAQGIYLDSACTRTGVLSSPPSCVVTPPDPNYVRVDAGCGRTRVYHVGAPVSPTPAEYYVRLDDGTCIAQTGGGSWRVYEVGAEVTPDAFVSARVDTESSAGSLAGTFYVAADGAQQRVGWRDTALGVGCEALPATDHALRCVPMSRTSPIAVGFADATCSMAARVFAACAAVPRFESTVTGTCGDVYETRAYGAPLPASAFHTSDSGGACGPPSPAIPADAQVVPSGDVVPPARLASIALASPGATRLTLVTEVGASGSPRPTSQFGEPLFHDTLLDLDCTFSTATSDGVMRCLPAGIFVGYATDAACTMLVAVQSAGTGACAAPPRFGVLDDRATACAPVRRRVFRVGASIASVARLYYRQAADRCIAGPAGASYPTFALGAEIPEAMFATGTDMTE